MNIPLYKISGTGNSFFIYDGLIDNPKNIDILLSGMTRADFAVFICNSANTSGADGFIVLHEDPDNNFAWDFYNADGSRAEMCGNASRCVVDYFVQKSGYHGEVSFKSLAGVIRGKKRSDGLISVEMTRPTELEELTIGEIHGFYLDTGVPHFVIEVSDIFATDLAELAISLKSHETFAPRSTNVTYYSVVKEGYVRTLTYERGVNGFTQACGTGAVAVSLAYKTKYSLTSGHVKLSVPGGELEVDLTDIHAPRLVGPVLWEEEFIFKD